MQPDQPAGLLVEQTEALLPRVHNAETGVLDEVVPRDGLVLGPPPGRVVPPERLPKTQLLLPQLLPASLPPTEGVRELGPRQPAGSSDRHDDSFGFGVTG